jgi:hypothetical protein
MRRQQDAHEFLRLVVDALQTAERSKSGTVVERIWGGKLRSRVQCSRCNSTSDTFEPLLDLSLELKGGSLDSALRHFCQTERLAGANAYRCERCKSLQSATKRLTVDAPPNVLVVHLKRFQFSFAGKKKLNQMVAYNETLDLTPYVSSPGASGAACRYRLTGVVVHSGGSMGSGHYYAYVRSGAGTWHRIDDSSVSTTSLQHALGQQAYILFYVRHQEKESQVRQEEQQQQKQEEEQEEQEDEEEHDEHDEQEQEPILPPTPPATRSRELATFHGRGVWYRSPSNHNIFETEQPVVETVVARTPFRPADAEATTHSSPDRQQLKRAMEEAEYDVGKQKKVRRKDEWDHNAPNRYQATAAKKWRKNNKTRIW